MELEDARKAEAALVDCEHALPRAARSARATVRRMAQEYHRAVRAVEVAAESDLEATIDALGSLVPGSTLFYGGVCEVVRFGPGGTSVLMREVDGCTRW
jgi:hypothetical protein